MPLYEYHCSICDKKFELLRPMSRSDESATCPGGHEGAKRLISTFAALSKGAEGEVSSVAGDSGCGTCSSGSCGTCGIS